MTHLKFITAGILASLAWAGLALYGGLSGWWLDPITERGDSRQFMDAAISMIGESSPGSVALVLIEDGEVYDEYYHSAGAPINADTVFATASLSKWPTAYAAMLLVEQGKIDLDAPVSRYLTRWQLPASDFDNEAVTVRRLLSHTAGLVDGLGYGDYTADETLPSLVESLDNPRGSDDEDVQIIVGREPGSEWDYSGGGYLVLELLVEEVTGMDFAEYMQEAVFAPLGMSRSSYQYLAELDNIAGSYERSGEPAPLYQYAARSATALASSAADLTRFAQAQLRADAPLADSSVSTMREPLGREMGMAIWGAGVMLYHPSGEGDYVFGHDGANDPSINASVRVNPDTGDAIVALSTGPAYLASRLAYQWGLWTTGYPDFIQANLAIESAMQPIMLGLLLIAVSLLLLALLLWRQRARAVAD
ncbi:MAG: serine hydrolase domain-containing protein [Halieaceae bacterium]